MSGYSRMQQCFNEETNAKLDMYHCDFAETEQKLRDAISVEMTV